MHQQTSPNEGTPRMRGRYPTGPHKPVVRGNRLYLSHYSDGLRAVDISRPASPREVAAFVPAMDSPRVDGVDVGTAFPYESNGKFISGPPHPPRESGGGDDGQGVLHGERSRPAIRGVSASRPV